MLHPTLRVPIALKCFPDICGIQVHERGGGRTCTRAGHVLGDGTAQKLMLLALEYFCPQLSSLYTLHSPL